MSAMIEYTYVNIENNPSLDITELYTETIIIPFIKKIKGVRLFTDEESVNFKEIYFYSTFEDFKRLQFEEKFSESLRENNIRFKLPVFEYIDKNNNLEKIIFPNFKKAEEFERELRSSINDFYNNTTKYIKDLT